MIVIYYCTQARRAGAAAAHLVALEGDRIVLHYYITLNYAYYMSYVVLYYLYYVYYITLIIVYYITL